MNAIEFALTEPASSHVPVVRATARDVLGARQRESAILGVPLARSP